MHVTWLTSEVRPRERGKDTDDKTSYLEEARDWGPERDDRPDILFQIDPVGTKPRRKDNKPGYMMFDGQVVLDYQGDPILDWKIPSTISSKMGGWEIKAYMRFHRELTIQDFLSRLPHQDSKGRELKAQALTMRCKRFRANAGYVVWISGREGSNEVREALCRVLPPECIAANSARGFRDLSKAEEETLSPGKGKHPNKARKKQSDSS